METNRHEINFPFLSQSFVFLRVHSWFKNFDLNFDHFQFLAMPSRLR